MEDKKLYYKVMLVVLVIILVLLGAALYHHSREFQKAYENYVPRGTVQQLQTEGSEDEGVTNVWVNEC